MNLLKKNPISAQYRKIAKYEAEHFPNSDDISPYRMGRIAYDKELRRRAYEYLKNRPLSPRTVFRFLFYPAPLIAEILLPGKGGIFLFFWTIALFFSMPILFEDDEDVWFLKQLFFW